MTDYCNTHQQTNGEIMSECTVIEMTMKNLLKNCKRLKFGSCGSYVIFNLYTRIVISWDLD